MTPSACFLLTALLLCPLTARRAAETPAWPVIMAERFAEEERFSGDLTRWWTEGGERIAVGEGRLRMSADNPGSKGGGAATAWWKVPHPADFELTLDAHGLSASTGGNNINLFFCYADPSGKPLIATRESRRSADLWWDNIVMTAVLPRKP